MLANAMRANKVKLSTVTAQGMDRLKALRAHFHASQAEILLHAVAVLLVLIAQADFLSAQVVKLEANSSAGN